MVVPCVSSNSAVRKLRYLLANFAIHRALWDRSYITVSTNDMSLVFVGFVRRPYDTFLVAMMFGMSLVVLLTASRLLVSSNGGGAGLAAAVVVNSEASTRDQVIPDGRRTDFYFPPSDNDPSYVNDDNDRYTTTDADERYLKHLLRQIFGYHLDNNTSHKSSYASADQRKSDYNLYDIRRHDTIPKGLDKNINTGVEKDTDYVRERRHLGGHHHVGLLGDLSNLTDKLSSRTNQVLKNVQTLVHNATQLHEQIPSSPVANEDEQRSNFAHSTHGLLLRLQENLVDFMLRVQESLAELVKLRLAQNPFRNASANVSSVPSTAANKTV